MATMRSGNLEEERTNLATRLAAILLATATLSACATVTHRHITDPNADASSTGIRYYGTSPYIIAYSDGKGGVVVSDILHLPDPAKKMSAEATTQLAEVGATMEFDRGVLTSATATADATTVPTAVLKAIEKLAPALIAAMDDPAKRKADPFQIPGPSIYKIVVKGGEPYLVGGASETPIKVTLLPQDKEK